MIDLFTDGSCIGNPGPGGWAWAALDGDLHRSGYESSTTNNRMELRAVIEALKTIDGPVTVHSDSKYVVDCFVNRWHVGWVRRGWKTAAKKPVANRDLWEELLSLMAGREVSFVWVKGHNGHAMNELVDRLARSRAEGRT